MGSIPVGSAKKQRPSCAVFVFLLRWRESNGSVLNSCRWQEDPTLTEPAGESDSQTSRRLDARGMFLLRSLAGAFCYRCGKKANENPSPKIAKQFLCKGSDSYVR